MCICIQCLSETTYWSLVVKWWLTRFIGYFRKQQLMLMLFHYTYREVPIVKHELLRDPQLHAAFSIMLSMSLTFICYIVNPLHISVFICNSINCLIFLEGWRVTAFILCRLDFCHASLWLVTSWANNITGSISVWIGHM